MVVHGQYLNQSKRSWKTKQSQSSRRIAAGISHSTDNFETTWAPCSLFALKVIQTSLFQQSRTLSSYLEWPVTSAQPQIGHVLWKIGYLHILQTWYLMISLSWILFNRWNSLRMFQIYQPGRITDLRSERSETNYILSSSAARRKIPWT